jgi:hypothetical protein
MVHKNPNGAVHLNSNPGPRVVLHKTSNAITNNYVETQLENNEKKQ